MRTKELTQDELKALDLPNDCEYIIVSQEEIDKLMDTKMSRILPKSFYCFMRGYHRFSVGMATSNKCQDCGFVKK